jgi:RND family efflux transporter MFP subunit
MQYLEAKNRKEALENQLRSVNTQIQKTYIKAPFSGTIDQMEAKLGMLAQPTVPLLRIISLDNLYITADVSEAYIGVMKKGEKAKVSFASLNEEFDSEISSIGQVIDPDNRTFSIEVKVPKVPYELKPNLISVVKIKDFEAENVAIVPTNLIQKDNRGDFVYVVAMNSETPIAKKVRVIRGRTYKNKTMIKEGLTGEEELVDEGFRDVSEGVNVNVVEDSII